MYNSVKTSQTDNPRIILVTCSEAAGPNPGIRKGTRFVVLSLTPVYWFNLDLADEAELSKLRFSQRLYFIVLKIETKQSAKINPKILQVKINLSIKEFSANKIKSESCLLHNYKSVVSHFSLTTSNVTSDT